MACTPGFVPHAAHSVDPVGDQGQKTIGLSGGYPQGQCSAARSQVEMFVVLGHCKPHRPFGQRLTQPGHKRELLGSRQIRSAKAATCRGAASVPVGR